jgi:hypothetical protein
METKLTLHGEILGVGYFFEIKCTQFIFCENLSQVII